MANVGDKGEATSTSQVTLAAPGQGRRWYLKDLTVLSDTSYVLTVQSPAGANKFRVTIPANMGYEKSWGEKGLEGAENAAMVIDVSAGTFDINYRAVVR